MSFSQSPKWTPDSATEPIEDANEQRKNEIVTHSSFGSEPLQVRLFAEKPTAAYRFKKTVPVKNWNYAFWIALVLILGGTITLSGCCTNSLFEKNQSTDISSISTYKPVLVLGQSEERGTTAASTSAGKKSRNPLNPIVTFFKKDTTEDVLGPEKPARSKSPNEQLQGPQRIPVNRSRNDAPQETATSQSNRIPRPKANEKKTRYQIQSRPTDSPEIVNLIADLNAAENVDIQRAEQELQELRQYNASKIQPDIYQFNIAVVRSKLIPVLKKYEDDKEFDEETLLPETLKRSAAQQRQTSQSAPLKRVPQRQEIVNESERTLQPPKKLPAKQLSRNENSSPKASTNQMAFDENEFSNAPPAPMPGAKNSNVYESLAQEMQAPKMQEYQQAATAKNRQPDIPQGRFAAMPEEDPAPEDNYNNAAAKYARPQSAYGKQSVPKTKNSDIQHAHYQRSSQHEDVPKINPAGYRSQETFQKEFQEDDQAVFRSRSRFSSEPERPVQEWEYATFSAIQSLKQQIAYSTDKEAVLADSLRLRLLETTLGLESESKHVQFPGADESVTNFITKEIQGLSTILDEHNSQRTFQERLQKAQPHLQEARDQLAKLCPLKIRNIQFIKHSGLNPPEIDDFLGYGKYTPIKAEFKVDDFAPIYMELENLTVHGNESVGYNIKANFDYEILDASGNSLVRQSVTPMDDTRKSKTWDIAYMIPIDLISLPPGHYHVIIRVIDQNHLRLQMDSQRLDFIIRAPTPKGPKS